METVVPVSETPSVEVVGTQARFPVHRIYCVGRNYLAHLKEMGHDPDRTPPTFFAKPADTLVVDGAVLPYPAMTKNLHHEIELVMALGKGGANIAADSALDHVFGYGVGIDLTRRDLQAQAKERGAPWEVAKSFELSAPCGALRPAAEMGHINSGRIWLSVNGEVRQDGDIGQMIWSCAEIVTELSKYFTLAPGDLIFTGTPSGVGPLEPGDAVTSGVDGVGTLTLTIG